MTTERIKEIQDGTGYPESLSVSQALYKVWNECAQEYKNKGLDGLFIGQTVYHKEIYDGREEMMVIGLVSGRESSGREAQVYLKGDYSGGTHGTIGRQWYPVNGVLHERNNTRAAKMESSLQKAKKKPVTVEFVRLQKNNIREVYEAAHGSGTIALASGVAFQKWDDYEQIVIKEGMKLKTPESGEGTQIANIGDYIVFGHSEKLGRHCWPVKPDYFEKAYDIVWDSVAGKQESKKLTTLQENEDKHQIDYHQAAYHQAAYARFNSNEPKLNGIACPECGAELYDSCPSATFLTNPPKTRIHCEGCDYAGFRTL